MNTCSVENILNDMFMKMFQCYEFSKPEVNDENQVCYGFCQMKNITLCPSNCGYA